MRGGSEKRQGLGAESFRRKKSKNEKQKLLIFREEP